MHSTYISDWRAAMSVVSQRVAGLVTVVLASALCGCGGASGPKSSVTIAYDGQSVTISVSDGSTVQESYGGQPKLTYSGPGGCKGRYFSGDVLNGLPVTFHYSSRDAYLVYNHLIYHFLGGPRVHPGRLVWTRMGAGDHIVVTAYCPPPPSSGPLLPRNVGL
jgi:hypothetical protein